ncbi:MAG: virulence RhuM family protein [Prevotellaceae bacterium]|jgi:hypothetical protein|nr:virulence RhuM family protein [Prevotellaceae bacterium]
MDDFEEYIRQGEASQKEKGYAWQTAILFFKTVQNKMHWAITGHTAAELIAERADSTKPNMGLTSWRGTKVRKEDTTVAKNYLTEDELQALNNLVEQYFVFAEGQAMRRIPMHMKDWIEKLQMFFSYSFIYLQKTALICIDLKI